MITERQRIELIGALGEEIVDKVLKEAGFSVQKSEDKYDSEKDFLVEGLKVEVKTVVPWFTENALTIDASQYRNAIMQTM
jgi:DNA-binding sugar fermentation-stimulating protein